MFRPRGWRATGHQPASARSRAWVLACRFWPFAALLLVWFSRPCFAQSDLPDAPAPQFLTVDSDDGPDASGAVAEPAPQQTFPPAVPEHRGLYIPGLQSGSLPVPRPCVASFCSQRSLVRSCCVATHDTFSAYLKQYSNHIYTPRELGDLALRSVLDPFNLLTIGGTSAITVASDSHSPYGPGMKGWSKLSGVALTQDMTSAFIETFLIPSIDHQDPHYHRMPNASLRRRIAHCIYQPFWTNDDLGGGMFNYATVIGAIAGEAVDISYVPYQQKGWGASADRIAVNLATTPIGNFATEFIPDLASHINLNVVFVQRIINRVAVEENGGGP